MWRRLHMIPALVLVAGLACLALGAIAVASLEGARNDQTEMFFIGLILTSLGVGLFLRRP